jgi:DNA-binding NarL/FixJ family response regulator
MTSTPSSFDATSLWIIEDSDDYREQLSDLLSLDESIDCQYAFASYEEARDQMEAEGAPEVILIDLNLPGIHGLQGIKELKQLYPTLQIIVLTVTGNRKSVFEALRSGAVGYLLKNEPFDTILQNIHEVIEGGASLSSSVTPYILDVLKTPTPDKPSSARTEHEIKILELLAKGLSRKEMADHFSVATVTIDYHLRSIYHKLEVHSTSGAVGKAFRMGVLK